MSLVNTVSTDLQNEVERLKTLLDQAKSVILTQANTIAQHVATLNNANSIVSQVTSDLKVKLDDFESLFSNNSVVKEVANVVSNTVANVVTTVETSGGNAVITVLDAALHDLSVATNNAVPATLHNLQELEKAYASIMANAGVSNLKSDVTLPSQVSNIVNAAKADASGVLHKVETAVENVAIDVKDGVEDVIEGKVKVGPVHI